MTSQPLFLYCASAGSGKTYTLSKKYILLLLSKRLIDKNLSPSQHKHILAITFTNKATTEMKERIIRDLFELSRQTNPEFLSDILSELQSMGTTVSADTIASHSASLLRDILHDYSNFSVSTIDMFFQKLIRGFLKELGIQPDYKLELNDTALIQQAIDVLLERITKSQVNEHKALELYIKEMLETGKWNLRSTLTSNANEVLARAYRTNYLHNIENLQAVDTFALRISQVRTKWKTALRNLGLLSRQIITDKCIQDKDFKYGGNGTLYKFLMTVSDQSYQYNFENRNLRIGFEAKRAMECGSKDPGPGFISAFPELQKIAFQAKDLCVFLTESDVFVENLNLLKIFHLIGESIISLQQEQNVRRLGDAQDLIEQIIHTNSIPFLYEKAGLRFHHLLLDEFQDTSMGQWNCLKPLMEEALSSDNSCLIVGDVKQSIYRWREGDWRILGESVPHDFGPAIQVKVLKKNWRSCAQIVSFNNELFTKLPSLVAQEYASGQGDSFSLVYKDVVQEIKDPNSGGFIGMHFCEDADYAWSQLGPNLHDVLKRGYACADIVVLVRDKKNAKKAAEAILAYQKSQPDFAVEIISQESLSIDAAISVQWMLAVLRLAQLHAEDRQDTKQLHLLEALTALENLFPKLSITDASTIELANQIHLKGVLWGLEAMTAWLNETNKMEALTEASFIQTFHTLVNKFCQDGNPSIRSFLEWWDMEKTHFIQTPSGKDAITIMTVHKSKGLEFPIVFLPSCDFLLGKQNRNKIWAYPGYITKEKINEYQELEMAIPSTPMLLNWNSSLKTSLYARRYMEEQELDALEALNLLYVALTRAECELHLWSTGQKSSLGTYLLELFETHGLWELQNDPNDPKHSFYLIGQTTTKVQTPPKGSTIAVPYISHPRSIALKVHPYSDRHPKADELFESPRVYGILMHRILECVESPDKLEALLEDDRFMDVNRNDLSICLSRVQKALLNPIARDWFSNDWELHKEAEIMLPPKHELGKSLRPDRVLINKNQVIVIDYKFGEQSMLQEARHTQQIRTYGSLIQAIEPQKKEILLYLWYVDKDRILEVFDGK